MLAASFSDAATEIQKEVRHNHWPIMFVNALTWHVSDPSMLPRRWPCDEHPGYGPAQMA